MAITWTDNDVKLIGPLRIRFREFLIGIQQFYSKYFWKYGLPDDTRRNNNVIITSKRRRVVVLT